MRKDQSTGSFWRKSANSSESKSPGKLTALCEPLAGSSGQESGKNLLQAMTEWKKLKITQQASAGKSGKEIADIVSFARVSSLSHYLKRQKQPGMWSLRKLGTKNLAPKGNS